MDKVIIKDKAFAMSMPEAEIKQRIKELAQQISTDMAGRNPLFLAVLNGSFIFAADLMRYLTIPSEISFVKLASYQGTTSVGKVKALIDNIHNAYRLVYQSSLTVNEAMERIKNDVPMSKEIQYIIDFVSNSKRGIIR